MGGHTSGRQANYAGLVVGGIGFDVVSLHFGAPLLGLVGLSVR
jgi:hypothetical protein